MNIFATNKCPKKSARFLDNKRVIKMITECNQLLCTALYLKGEIAPYKPTHINHPCTKWVCESVDNYMWIYNHCLELCKIYTEVYDKIHKGETILKTLPTYLHKYPKYYVNCARNKLLNLDFTNIENVFDAYKNYLHIRWLRDKNGPKWGVDNIINIC